MAKLVLKGHETSLIVEVSDPDKYTNLVGLSFSRSSTDGLGGHASQHFLTPENLTKLAEFLQKRAVDLDVFMLGSIK